MAAVHSQPPQSVFPKSHVGFDSITNQIEKKLLKRGFQFNVICVGMSSSSTRHAQTAHPMALWASNAQMWNRRISFTNTHSQDKLVLANQH